MEDGGSSVGNGKAKKVTATRRTWNTMEEHMLMDCLKELIPIGNWKSENGFRPGYLQKLEQMMREKLPGTDIRATPHINSRITIWKRHHGCLQIALEGTGSGFNSMTKIIDVSDTSWVKAVKKEPTIAGMRYKPWPFYYDWIEVFGLDKANRKACEDVTDAANEDIQDENQTKIDEEVLMTSNVHVEEDFGEDMDTASQAPTVETTKVNKTSSKKRHSPSLGDNNVEIIDGLTVLFKQSDENLANIVKNFGVETSGAVTGPVTGPVNRQNVWSMLENIPGLSLDELLDASENLSKNPARLEMFMGFPEHARPRYVRRLLDGDFDKP